MLAANVNVGVMFLMRHEWYCDTTKW